MKLVHKWIARSATQWLGYRCQQVASTLPIIVNESSRCIAIMYVVLE